MDGISRLLIGCLLYQSLLAVAAMPRVVDTPRGKAVTMCTQHGLQAMFQTADPDDDRDRDASPGGAGCPFCVMAHLMHSASPPTAMPCSPAIESADSWAVPRDLSRVDETRNFFSPIRAPPHPS